MSRDESPPGQAFRDASARLRAVLDASTDLLPASVLDDLRELVHYNESVIALENLCSHLHDDDVIVPADTVRAIRELAAALKVALGPWFEAIRTTP
ncbi:MAG: MafI family immunity protein [Deltaproteobacteria bacterium]|nr:MafI family immunity protein [Deltaproteobacteria bacterium]